jgi:hypothetical protein
MNNYINLITFIIITLLYFFKLKPTLTNDILNDSDAFYNYTKSNYIYLGVYYLFVLLSQILLNSANIINLCGGSITKNIGVASLITILPWTFIFGIIIITLIIYPGFKSAFSDVIGYFYVSNSAHKLLSDLLLMDEKITDDIDKATINDPSTKKAMKHAANTIIKLFGNISILINQIVPSNFKDYWNLLEPLMKPEYRDNIIEQNKIKNDFLNIVISRDNVGEAMWYIYTGVLIIAIVQYSITLRGCITDSKTMQQNYKTFLEKEQKDINKKTIATSQTYTVTS